MKGKKSNEVDEDDDLETQQLMQKKEEEAKLLHKGFKEKAKEIFFNTYFYIIFVLLILILMIFSILYLNKLQKTKEYMNYSIFQYGKNFLENIVKKTEKN